MSRTISEHERCQIALDAAENIMWRLVTIPPGDERACQRKAAVQVEVRRIIDEVLEKINVGSR